MSIFIIVKYGKARQSSTSKNLWLGIIRNPLIIACMLAIIFNLLGVKIPRYIIGTAEFLGRSALPFRFEQWVQGLNLTLRDIMLDVMFIA